MYDTEVPVIITYDWGIVNQATDGEKTKNLEAAPVHRKDWWRPN